MKTWFTHFFTRFTLEKNTSNQHFSFKIFGKTTSIFPFWKFLIVAIPARHHDSCCKNSQQHIILCCFTKYKNFPWILSLSKVSRRNKHLPSSPKPHKEEEKKNCWVLKGIWKNTKFWTDNVWCGTRGVFPFLHRKTRVF